MVVVGSLPAIAGDITGARESNQGPAERGADTRVAVSVRSRVAREERFSFGNIHGTR